MENADQQDPFHEHRAADEDHLTIGEMEIKKTGTQAYGKKRNKVEEREKTGDPRGKDIDDHSLKKNEDSRPYASTIDHPIDHEDGHQVDIQVFGYE